MCEIIKDRIKVIKILYEVIDSSSEKIWRQDELSHLCFLALQMNYYGLCLDECLEAKARNFAVWYLARGQRVECQSVGPLSKAA
jgi:hypothetical protein